jgi:hypothetical protein
MEKQIPCGDDSKNGKCNDKDKSQCRDLSTARYALGRDDGVDM